MFLIPFIFSWFLINTNMLHITMPLIGKGSHDFLDPVFFWPFNTYLSNFLSLLQVLVFAFGFTTLWQSKEYFSSSSKTTVISDKDTDQLLKIITNW